MNAKITTAESLIAELKKYPPNTPVLVEERDDGGYFMGYQNVRLHLEPKVIFGDYAAYTPEQLYRKPLPENIDTVPALVITGAAFS